MLWRSVPADSLAWRDFDGEIVLRNARTGNTHLLDRFSAELLLALIDADAPIGVEALEAELRARGLSENAERWASAIEQVLSEFQRLGLAEPERG